MYLYKYWNQIDKVTVVFHEHRHLIMLNSLIKCRFLQNMVTTLFYS